MGHSAWVVRHAAQSDQSTRPSPEHMDVSQQRARMHGSWCGISAVALSDGLMASLLTITLLLASLLTLTLTLTLTLMRDWNLYLPLSTAVSLCSTGPGTSGCSPSPFRPTPHSY